MLKALASEVEPRGLCRGGCVKVELDRAVAVLIFSLQPSFKLGRVV